MTTIDEAIKYCLEVAEHNEALIKRGYAVECNSHDCSERAENHRQLAEWLTELKELRSIVDACNILAVDVFAVEKLCKELKEAKILLKSAIENAQRVDVNGDVYYDWIGADEALKLIGDEDNEH